MAAFSLFLRPNPARYVLYFVAMATAQNSTTGLTFKSCLKSVRKFQLDTLSRFGMVEKKREGSNPPSPLPPGKIGLSKVIQYGMRLLIAALVYMNNRQ